MTTEEAIRILEGQFDKSCRNYRYQNAQKLDFEDALWMAISALREQERRRLTGHECPCDFCRFWPPSSGDGKPCTICPAEAKEE